MDAEALSCERCRYLSDAERAHLGCVQPVSPTPYTFTGCYLCKGYDRSCKVCRGSNHWEVDRCPGALLEPDVALAIRQALLALDHGIMPEPGNVLDQTSLFLEVQGFVGSERYRRHEAKRKRAETQQRLHALAARAR